MLCARVDLDQRQSSVAVDVFFVAVELAMVVVAHDIGEVVRATVAHELENVVAKLAAAAHPEAVETDSMAIRPAQTAEDIRILDRGALVAVGAVLAVVADGNVCIWRR